MAMGKHNITNPTTERKTTNPVEAARERTNTDNTEGPSDVGPPTGRETPGTVALASLNSDLTIDGTDRFIDPEMGRKELAQRKELMGDG